ncbi:unnamed protein product, partial [Amoebophrya sp. A120]
QTDQQEEQRPRGDGKNAGKGPEWKQSRPRPIVEKQVLGEIFVVGSVLDYGHNRSGRGGGPST